MSSTTWSETLASCQRALGPLIKRDAAPLLVAAAFIAVIGFAGYKIYEHRITGGVGFIDATEMSGLDELRIAEKKRQFFGTLRPVVEAENAKILELRSEIEAARNAGESPGWLRDTAADYGVQWSGVEWRNLLRRVDAVPLTLALAQAANESSWGQSRFAQEGNNLFGQWCFEEGCGLVPEGRPEGASYEVRSFDSINESVRSYLRNINTHIAYRDLRVKRAKARRNEGRLASGVDLAGGLGSYSERGDDYIDEIRATIRINRGIMLGEPDDE